MDVPLAVSIRSKILGAVLRHTRLRAGLFAQECAVALGCDVSQIEAYETGRIGIPFPQLEIWASLTGTPVSQLLSDDFAPNEVPIAPRDPRILQLRSKMLGVLLRQARVSAGKSLDDAAAVAGIEPSSLGACEEGKEGLSVAQLELVTAAYGVRLAELSGEALPGVPVSAASGSKAPALLEAAPCDLPEFVYRPESLRYLLFAEQISRLPAETLRRLGQALVETWREP